MKLPKIILASIAIAAVLGGTFAFKARQAVVIYTHNPADSETVCTVSLRFWTVTLVAPVQTLATTDPTLPCVLTKITTTP